MYVSNLSRKQNWFLPINLAKSAVWIGHQSSGYNAFNHRRFNLGKDVQHKKVNASFVSCAAQTKRLKRDFFAVLSSYLKLYAMS